MTSLQILSSLRPARFAFFCALALGTLFAHRSWLSAQEGTDPAPVAADEEVTHEAAGETTGDTAPEFAGKVMVGKIDSDIGLSESAFVKRLIDEATAAEVELLVLELNTFGGRVDAAVLIRDAILDAPMSTAVFINKRAISAGALISLACESIIISPGGTIGAATPIQTAPGQELPQAVEEKYLSYFRQEMRVTAETRGRNGDIAEAMVDADTVVEGVSDEGKLLTLTTKSALENGIADHEARDLDEALVKLGYPGTYEELDRSWSEDLVGFLTSQAITSLLFLAMVAFAYLEYQTPGFGFFGGAAIFCFLMLYFSHYLVNLAGWEELLLFIVGVVLIIVEVAILPGFGIIGLAGLLSLLASAVLILMAGDWSDFSFDNPFTREALAQVFILVLLALALTIVLIRYVSLSDRNPLGQRLVLDAQGLEVEAGYMSHDAPDEGLAGRTGVALTTLRPAGKARIDGRRVEVETEGEYIEKGEEVKVLRQEPGRTIVRKV